jgi:hypothetical protein
MAHDCSASVQTGRMSDIRDRLAGLQERYEQIRGRL